MFKPALITPVILSPNIVLLLDWFSGQLVQNNWYFFDYPAKQRSFTVYNCSSRGAAASAFLPFFTFFVADGFLLFANNTRLDDGKVKAVLNHGFNNFVKTINQATFGHIKVLQFVGFRFRQRWFNSVQAMRLRLGYNKKVWIKCPDDFVVFIKKLTPKKRTHFLFSFDYRALKEVIDCLYIARTASRYRGRGVNIKEKPMESKIGKKTLW